jgi:pre-mRNA-splicing factor SYF2
MYINILLLLQNEARQMNHQEVVEEDRRSKLPPNWEARKRQAEWVIEDERKRKEAEARVIKVS